MADTKVLVVDDMGLYRKILKDVVDHLPGAVTVGTAVDGQNALIQVERLDPDLILLDVEMPVMDGLTTLKHLHRRYPNIRVVMVSGTSKSAVDLTMQALEQGAVDFIEKPAGANPNDSRRRLREALTPVLRHISEAKASQEVRVMKQAEVQQPPMESLQAVPGAAVAARGAPGGVARTQGRSVPTLVSSTSARTATGDISRNSGGTVTALRPRSVRAVPSPAPAAPAKEAVGMRRDVPPRFSVLAIGTSTGGPAALAQLIPLLPANLPVPVVIVQHMPPGFTQSLASRLDSRSPLAVKEAAAGDVLVPGGVLVAPGGRHMAVVKKNGVLSVQLHDEPPVRSCRPSVDVLFKSLAVAMDVPVLSVVMTGMGDDGADGVAALAPRGSYNLVQDEASCVVYGMPRAVAERGLAHETMQIDRLARRIRELLRCGEGAE